MRASLARTWFGKAWCRQGRSKKSRRHLRNPGPNITIPSRIARSFYNFQHSPATIMATTRPAKKRRTEGARYVESNVPITNARELTSFLSDYSGSGRFCLHARVCRSPGIDVCGTGIKSFKDFLGRCSKGAEVDEVEAARNRAMLKDYLETQCRNAGKDEEDAEKEAATFSDFVQIWGYANQVGSRLPGRAAVLQKLTKFRTTRSLCCRSFPRLSRPCCGYAPTTKNSRDTEPRSSRACCSPPRSRSSTAD